MKIILTIVFSFFLMSTASASLEEIFGNAEVGDSCGSDYQCQTLCCKSDNGSGGVCAEHSSQQSCNKPVGQSCVSNEFCKADYVPVCRVVKIGLKPDGTQACALRCPAVEKKGACVNNVCLPPSVPPVPPFDPNDCSNAS